jgi:hypothetical protein
LLPAVAVAAALALVGLAMSVSSELLGNLAVVATLAAGAAE